MMGKRQFEFRNGNHLILQKLTLASLESKTGQTIVYGGSIGCGKTFFGTNSILHSVINCDFHVEAGAMIVENSIKAIKERSLNTIYSLLDKYAIWYKYNQDSNNLSLRKNTDPVYETSELSIMLRGADNPFPALDEYKNVGLVFIDQGEEISKDKIKEIRSAIHPKATILISVTDKDKFKFEDEIWFPLAIEDNPNKEFIGNYKKAISALN